MLDADVDALYGDHDRAAADIRRSTRSGSAAGCGAGPAGREPWMRPN
jgi:hypothetical protein